MVYLLKRYAARGMLLALAALALLLPVLASATGSSSWPSGGHDISNTHSNPAEAKLNAENVKNLAVKWTYTTQGDVSANPAVVDGAVYFPDWGGYLHKVNAATGAGIWSKKISDYDGIPGSVSRASPAVVGNTVYLGDQNGGYLSAGNATAGNAIWAT